MRPGKHRIGGVIFGLGVGIVTAVLAFRWVADPAPRQQRLEEEAAVVAARSRLTETLGFDVAGLVDPLSPDRKVGKAYVYRDGEGWQVSGYYRRGPDDPWHPFLLDLSAEHELLHLKISDPALLDRNGETDLEVLP